MRFSLLLWLIGQILIIHHVHAGQFDYEAFPMTPQHLYHALDLEQPKLSSVRKAVAANDYDKAAKELYKHYRKNAARFNDLFGVADMCVQCGGTDSKADVLLKRTYSFGGVTHTYQNGMDWLYNPTRARGEYNQEWNSHIGRFRDLPTLANAYRKTRNEAYAKEVVYLITDFLKQVPVPLDEKVAGAPDDLSRLIYNKLSVARRLTNWTHAFFSVLESQAMTPDHFVTIYLGIYNHLLRMEKYPYLDYHNMGVADAEVLLKQAFAFSELKKSRQWVQWALERGLDQMDHVVYPDGTEKELCPRYHQGVISDFVRFYTVSREAAKKQSGEFAEKLDKMAEFVVKLSRPDGSIPAFNEMLQARDSKTPRARVRSVHRLTGKNEVLNWYGSGGRSGKQPAYTSVALDWSGYYVMRSGWDANAAYMVVKAGPFGLAHQQEDKLSFELYARGELFLVDPGYYIYNSKSNWRKYFRSSLAHNTIVPDGLSQFRSAQRELWENKEPNDAIWQSTGDYDFFSGTYVNGYGRYEKLYDKKPEPLLHVGHQRDILFIKPGYWIMIDWMTPADQEQHQYEALFQSLYPQQASGPSLVIKGEKTDLHIVSFGRPEQGTAARVVSGQEGEIPRGWIYDVENDKIPLPAGVIGHKAAGATSQYYALIPGRFAKAPETTSFAVTGGQAVGGTVTTDDGLTVTFIAQAKQGMVIQGGGLSTNGRLKAVVEQRGQPKKEIEIY